MAEPLTIDELLQTTRAVRKRLDFERELDLELVHECLELALQAPSGSNAQGWHFVLVTDPDKRQRIGELYAQAFDAYRGMPISAHALADRAEGADRKVMDQVVTSAEYLAANLARTPALVIPCVEGRCDAVTGPIASLSQAGLYGSILPALWSFMLAARSRGIGTAWTTLHLMYEKEVAELLGIPYDTVTQAALSPVAFYKGETFKPAKRRPLTEVLHTNSW